MVFRVYVHQGSCGIYAHLRGGTDEFAGVGQASTSQTLCSPEAVMALRSRVAVVVALLAVAAACGGDKKSSPALSIGPGATIPKGSTHPFTAKLTQNGVETDCTATAQWTSSDPAVAGVAGGIASAVGVGRSTIGASCSSSTVTAVLVVSPAEVVSLAVSPATGELPVGLKEQLTAIATLTDGTTADFTANVIWSSDNTAAFTLANVSGLEGVATAQPPAGQSATITALHVATGAQASVSRSVTAETLASIELSPLAPSAPLGKEVQFYARGTFTDGHSGDVTPSFTWTSSLPGVAAFDPADHPGLLNTDGIGTTTITATRDTITAPTTLTVTAPIVASLAIDPPAATLTVGETLQLGAIATLTDGTTQSVTLSGWTSSVPNAATASGTGFLTAVAAGSSTVGGSYTDGAQTVMVTTGVEIVVPSSKPILSYLSLSRELVIGPASVTGKVALTASAASNTTVTLESSDPTYGAVAPSVTIPAGAASATFPITITTPPSKTPVTITATLGGAGKSATLNLRK